MSEMPSSAISFSVGPLGSSLATSCSSRSRSTRRRATACSRWLTPLSGTSALAIAMMRLRTRCSAGLNNVGVDAERNDMQLIGRHCEVFGDVGGRRRRDGQQFGDLVRDVLLHLREPVPAAHQRLAPPSRRRHVEDAVAGDRMVHRRHHRQPQLGDLQQAGAEALVVVHHVEVGEALGQHPRGAQAERPRLGKARRPRRQQLEQVDAAS